jgi:PAS domain S-box-containing protein/putative nucleotidyltransferase with HDIG domain
MKENRSGTSQTTEHLLHEITELRKAAMSHEHTEKALKKSKEEYRELVELANSIIFRMDTSGKITFFNEFAQKFFGYPKEEIVGKNLVGTIVPPVESSGRDLAALIKSIFTNPDKYTINENENMRKDGSRVWVLWTNRAILDDKNRASEILCIGSDITDRKAAEKALSTSRDELETMVKKRTWELQKAYEDLRFEIVARKVEEEALRESEARYRNIVEGSAEGIFQITPEGKYVFANASLSEMLGYDSHEEFIASVTNPKRQLYVHPEHWVEHDRLLKKQGQIKDVETEFYRKDGGRIWVFMNIRAVHDERGSFICHEGTVQDITLRKQGEEALKQSFAKLNRIMGGTIKALSMAIEIRDPYTAGHQIRVTQLAVAIAREMGFSEEHVKAIQVAGILHDIGKIYVPAEILTRPGKISSNEFAVLRDHSQAGFDILKDIEFDYPIAQIVLQHHERMDGTGYPQGLSGEEISIDARIISVADVVESMASHRPYRPSLGMSRALSEIRENKGKLYDETVVDVCLKLFGKKKFRFE